MSIYTSITYWIFMPEVWVILGILLIAADFTIGADFVILPIGISALIMAFLIQAQESLWFGDTLLFNTWSQLIMWFAGLSVVSVAIIKFAFQRRRKDEPDINKY